MQNAVPLLSFSWEWRKVDTVNSVVYTSTEHGGKNEDNTFNMLLRIPLRDLGIFDKSSLLQTLTIQVIVSIP